LLQCRNFISCCIHLNLRFWGVLIVGLGATLAASLAAAKQCKQSKLGQNYCPNATNLKDLIINLCSQITSYIRRRKSTNMIICISVNYVSETCMFTSHLLQRYNSLMHENFIKKTERLSLRQIKNTE